MYLRSAPRTRLLPSVFLAGALAIGAACRVFAASYYVDYSAGTDTNAGTSSSAAWQHCPGDSAAAGLAGTTTLAAGDTVFFKGGVAYVLTGSTGIILRSSGTSGAPITFDGNSANAWGTGKARFTDNNGGNGIAAFSAPAAVSYLAFKGIEFGAIGGTATLPTDLGSPVPARFGAGVLFNAGVTNTTIDGCVFHDLGYAYNQKPMNAASIAGTGIGLSSCDTLTISNCDFSHMAAAIEMINATSLANLTITNCTFHDSVCWTVDLPAVAPTNFVISGCTDTNDTQFLPASWLGYGPSPRTDVETATAGDTVTLTVAAAASPAATFQWQKNGMTISGATANTLTLSSVSSADSATYTAIATNTAGAATSNDAILTVNAATVTAVAPTFTTQPASQTVIAGSAVTFTVAASGTPTPTYQWLKNGTAISGATTNTLTLPAVSSTDAATYTATATNSAGTATSNAAVLTVNAPTPTAIAPTFTTQPVSQTAVAGSNVTFTVAASGTPAPTYQWLKNGTAISGSTNATLTLPSITTTDSATYVAVATNSAGSVNSSPATLTVTSAPAPTPTPTPTPTPVPTTVAPVITLQPVSQTVAQLSNVTFTVAASGTPAPTFQWMKNGVAISGQTSTTLSLTKVTSTDAGTYAAVATNSVGAATSTSATLTVTSPSTAPVFKLHPKAQTATAGTAVTFTASATATPQPTYQWMRNGFAIAGQTTDTLSLASVSASDAATYTVVASNSAGSATSNPAQLTVAAADSSKLANLSVRGLAGTGSDTLMVGFVVSGTTPKSLLIRGVGPTLGTYSVTGALSDPQLSLFSGSSLLATNNGWSTSADAGLIAATSKSVGAFQLAAGSGDSALEPTVGPGSYTAQISSATSNSGVALIELYDALTSPGSRLVNASVRTNVTAANSPIIGFVVSGTAPKKLLIRAIGPGLQTFSVDGAIRDPRIDIMQGGAVIQSNDNWAGDATLSDAFKSVGAFPLNAGSNDAALILNAAPGSYSAVVSGVNGAQGVVLVEVYELP